MASVKHYVITLDLSTTCTGWALFETKTGKLINFGKLKPSNKGLSKFNYPKKQLYKMYSLVDQIMSLLKSYENHLSNIIIEEVNLHKSRLAGKTLDGLHWILLDKMSENMLNKTIYVDSDGPNGWRTRLNLRLNEYDRKTNKERKKINKSIPKGQKKYPIIGKKHLACRYVNSKLGTNFDVDKNPGDDDIVDSIGLGLAYFLDK